MRLSLLLFSSLSLGDLRPVCIPSAGCHICNDIEDANFSQLEESILVLRSLGVQTTTISPYYLVPPTTRFIPTSQIRDILIHEAFRGFEVRYYLAVIVDGEAEVVVVFPVSILSGSES